MKIMCYHFVGDCGVYTEIYANTRTQAIKKFMDLTGMKETYIKKSL